MKCVKIEGLAKLYQMGEADFFQRKIFENHIKNCASCREKYKEVLLLSALLFSSPKTAKRNYLAETVAGYALKLLLVSLTAGLVTFGGYSAMRDAGDKTAVQKQSIPAEAEKITDELMVSPIAETEKQPESKLTNSGIRIKAVDGNRSVNIEVDNDTMKIRNRTENGR